MTMKSSGVLPGVLVASAAAGPIFLLFIGLASLYLQLPRPIVIDAWEATGILYTMPFAMIFGACFSLPANIVGALSMAMFGRYLACARTRLAWALAGGLCGGLLAWVFASDSGLREGGIATVMTSVACAVICRHFIVWTGRRERRASRNHAAPSARVVP
jgi:hypothetical protein